MRQHEEVDFLGMRYVVPVVVGWPGTIIAVNVGGAVIPTLLSFYLYVRNELWIRGIIAIACVAAVCHFLAQPVPGVGIALPVFVPPLSTAVVALLLSRRYAAPLAYIGGSMGTLVGADLLNLGKMQGLGAPVASIGGAGTFDGIFLTAILAVLLASIFSPPVRRSVGGNVGPAFVVNPPPWLSRPNLSKMACEATESREGGSTRSRLRMPGPRTRHDGYGGQHGGRTQSHDHLGEGQMGLGAVSRTHSRR